MIEMLGVGVRDGQQGWLLHRVCTRLDGRTLVAVVAANPGERSAFLDVAAGHLVPAEGRAWINGVPLMADTRGRVRHLVADVDLTSPLRTERSILWNVLAAGRPVRRALNGFLRLPRGDERRRALAALAGVGLEGGRISATVASLDGGERARLLVACVLARRPEWLAVRDPDAALGPGAAPFLERLARLPSPERVSWLVSLGDFDLGRRVAGRLIVLHEGRLVFDGDPARLASPGLSTAVHRELHRHPR